MLLRASQLLQKFVLVEDLDGHVGTIERIIIDPQDGQVRAFGVKPPGLFVQEKYLSVIDILGLVREGFVIRDPDQITGLDELVRVADILKQKIPVLGQAAKTVGGQSLGRVEDLLIELDTWSVTKYYLRGLLDERIIAADQVHSMTRHAIIFLDQPGGTPTKVTEVEPAGG